MEKLKLDLIELNKALKTVESILNLQKKVVKTEDQEILLAVEDSIIKRFEYTYESFWKFLKRYLEVVKDLEDINSPKKVFRTCVEAGILSSQEGDIFIDMADDRNETSHRYSIETSRIILCDVPRYYNAMIVVTTRIGHTLSLEG